MKVGVLVYYLCTRRVPQVVCPVDFKSQMVVGMNHFMCHCVFKMSLVLHFIRTDQNAILRVESTSFPIRAATAIDVMV